MKEELTKRIEYLYKELDGATVSYEIKVKNKIEFLEKLYSALYEDY